MPSSCFSGAAKAAPTSANVSGIIVRLRSFITVPPWMSDTATLQEFPAERDTFRNTSQMPWTAYNAPMASWKYDVIIGGAGPAGITAAIALAKAQIPVLVIEAGVFPGAENWSGAVYFTENLAQPDVLGEQAVRDSR